MDFCFNCGGKTDPDWVFCRACGSSLEENSVNDLVAAPAVPGSTPKVELISRGWNEVIETVEVPADPLADDDGTQNPVSPGAVEVTVDDITVIETVEEEEPAPARPAAVDPWDHLRPHGDLPPLQRYVTLPARVGQALVLLAALAALSAAGIHFYLNTRLDAFRDGGVSARLIDDIEVVADMSLLVAGGFLLIAGIVLIWWLVRTWPTGDFRPGKGGVVALISLIAGIALIGGSYALETQTVTEAIAVNSLIVLGLGLIMTACLATVRTIERIDRKEPA